MTTPLDVLLSYGAESRGNKNVKNLSYEWDAFLFNLPLPPISRSISSSAS